MKSNLITEADLASLKDKKLLVIVESPNKTKSVSSIFTALGYTQVKVLPSIGHTTYIKDDRKSYKNTGIYPDQEFKVNRKVAEDKYKVMEDLKAQAKWADLVFIASDDDREGEDLGWHIKEALKLKQNDYFRLRYNAITKEAIAKAIKCAGKFDNNLVEAAESRAILDKLVGYSLSPIAKSYVGAKSVGRCQSAGLKLIVDRENEINNFIPEQYYNLYLNFDKNKIKFKARYVGTTILPVDKITDIKQIKKIKEACAENKYIIEDIIQKEKQEAPKPPFCTATFQQEISSKLGLKVKDAMSVAQKLFEGINIGGDHIALITYIRTDATDISPDFIPTLKNYVENTYGKKAYVAPRKGKKSENAQEGHECLRITDPTMTPEKLASYISNDLQLKVYKIIWQRTIAAALPNAKISETTYKILNGEHVFNLVSKEVTDEGYRAIYSYKDDEIEESGLVKESFKLKEELVNTELEDIKKITTPPARYTEASLIKELQKTDIGRPSTFATIVDTVLSPTRNYCVLEDKYIYPTERGIQLASFLDRSFSNIINLNYTRDMEKSLDLIANGKLSRLDFLNDFFKNLEDTIKNNTEAVPTTNLSEKLCPKCGAPMIIRRSRFGKLFYGCSTYPQCNGIVNME